MLDQRRVAAQPDEKREQLFTERYESLLAWALRLTNQQREAAEDLVQDAFVQFVLGRTRLEEIENIDGYLRRMLRYMHVSRLSRSAQHLDDEALSVGDYDTCWLGWTAIEPPRRMQASEELYGICSYACSRKETSRAGSVLILRFFLDFFPSEIARILNCSRHSVDELQRFARREAKLFMNEPRRLHFVDNKRASERPRIKYLKSGCDLMLELRRMIFASCHGECLAQRELEQLYGSGNTDALTTPKLAHVVSCPKCLDAVASLLGLPLLSERYSSEPSNSDEPPPNPGEGGGASGGGMSGGNDLPQKFGRRLRETHEHKPQELRIAVNGFLVSSLTVSSDLSELDLNLTAGDPSAAVAAAFLFLKARMSSELTATVLLDRAIAAEQNAHRIPDKVRHRYVRLEERRSAEGAVVAQRKIEIWENRASGNRSQRLYDDSSKLIAGAWQKPDGSRTVYHHGLKPRLEPAITSPDNLLLNLEDVWQLEPSAKTFRALIAEPAVVRVEERSTTYILTYDKGRTIGASQLLKATLVLTKSDLHAIEQTLLVQRGSESRESREYRFVEATFELVPLKEVAPGAFEIEPELTGGAARFGEPGDWASRDLTASRVPPSPGTSAPPPASAELEVDVAYLLNQAKADRNEQVTLTRSAGGSLRVEGVVDTQQRKDEFLRVLGPVINNPAVSIEIRTVAEATARRAPVGSVVVEQTAETANTVAADEELRAYFSRTKPGGPTDEAIRSFSSRVVNGAYRALFHAIEMKTLVSRFANVDMRTVAPDARAKWLRMLHQHAAAFARENEALQQEIRPIFFAGSSSQSGAGVSVQSDAELARAVEQLHKLALSNNDAIRWAFTTSAQSSAAGLKSNAFWQSLQRVENLAEGIMQYQSN